MAALKVHDGQRFRAEHNAIRGSWLVVCKVSGRYVYCSGDMGHKMGDALLDGWKKFGTHADADDVWQWIWLNCGFYRIASGV